MSWKYQPEVLFGNIQKFVFSIELFHVKHPTEETWTVFYGVVCPMKRWNYEDVTFQTISEMGINFSIYLLFYFALFLGEESCAYLYSTTPVFSDQRHLDWAVQTLFKFKCELNLNWDLDLFEMVMKLTLIET